MPIVAGASYLTAAVRVLRQHKIDEVAESLEFWSINHVWPSLIESFSSASADRTIEGLPRTVDAGVLPRLHAELTKVLQPAPSRIAEGLVCAYDRFYGPTIGKVLAFLDVRPAASTFAIVEHSVPRFQLYTPSHDPGDRVTILNFDEALNQVEKGLAFYEQASGKPVDELVLAGDGALVMDFGSLTHRLGPNVRVQVMDLRSPQNVEDKSLAPYAAEIGLAVKASNCAAGMVKEVSNASAVKSAADAPVF